MADLGKAYVQIVPSAEGISGSISKVLDGEAGSAGDSAGETVGSNLVSKLKTIIAAAGIGEFVKSAVSEGADYEQAVGGMETLYKDSSATMIKYANEAFKTAQLSANDYMETATQFSASLLSSLGGDTEQAAEAANTAIIDMADNANKMGTSMQSIQDAYKGFAKQNYTMLDNLSLGYGGTKTEMERLLADAQKISGVEYNIDNLNDVYSAIHVIQQEMGITGTSALEAGTTVSGAVATMQSAWSNLLAQMTSSEGGDVKGAVQNLITSIFGDGSDTNLGVLGTVIPSIARLAESIGPALITAITASFESISTLVGEGGIQTVVEYINGIMSNLANVAVTGMEMLTRLYTGVLSALPKIITGAGQVILAFANGILNNLPQVLAKGAQMITSIISGISQNLPKITAAAGQVIGKLLSTIVNHLPQILAQGVAITVKIAAGLIQALPSIISAVVSLVANIVSGFATGTDWGSVGVNIIKGIVNGLQSMASALWDAITDIAKGAFNAVKEFFGIASPSKLMRDEIGRYIPAGIAEGITGNAGLVSDAMDDIGAGALNSTLSVNSGRLGAVAGSSTGATNVSMTIYGAEGQDVSALADIIADRINGAVQRQKAVFA